MQIAFLAILFIVGACLGSFLCCQARRLHLRTAEPVRPTKPTKATKSKSAKSPIRLGKRSVCLHCGYQLKWYDNLPLISWLVLKGKCRKCGKKIGLAELLSEFGVGLAFLTFGLGLQFRGITLEIMLDSQPLITWLSLATMLLVFIPLLAFLAIYDGLYGQLPTLYLTFSIICAIIIITLREWASFSNLATLGQHLVDLLFAFLILGGLYFVLYKVSKGKWVGDGDWLLGTALALALGTPWLALLTLFIANFLACLVMLPTLKRNKTHQIYFGPFMVIAFIIVSSFF